MTDYAVYYHDFDTIWVVMRLSLRLCFIFTEKTLIIITLRDPTHSVPGEFRRRSRARVLIILVGCARTPGAVDILFSSLPALFLGTGRAF